MLKTTTITLTIVTVILLPFQIPQYGAYYIACGFKKPVKVLGTSIDSKYMLPESADYDTAYLFVKGYHCTEKDAQQAGLKDIDRLY